MNKTEATERDLVTEVEELLTNAQRAATSGLSFQFDNYQTRKLFHRLVNEVERLRRAITNTLDENQHLADGDDCTLINLKRAVPEWSVEHSDNERKYWSTLGRSDKR